MFDVNGTVTTNKAESVKNVYTLTFDKLISGASTNNILVTKFGSASTITVQTPSEAGLSSTPFSGRYRVKCVDKNGVESFS